MSFHDDNREVDHNTTDDGFELDPNTHRHGTSRCLSTNTLDDWVVFTFSYFEITLNLI